MTGQTELFKDLKSIKKDLWIKTNLQNLKHRVTPLKWDVMQRSISQPILTKTSPKLNQEEILDRVLSLIPDEFLNDPWLCWD